MVNRKPNSTPAVVPTSTSTSALNSSLLSTSKPFWRRLKADATGAATAEYAVATLAAVGFAGLLVAILRSDEVRGILTDLIRGALTVAG